MAVSEATARKAVTRWDLEGQVEYLPCSCRKWHPHSIVRSSRMVYSCRVHSPGWMTGSVDA